MVEPDLHSIRNKVEQLEEQIADLRGLLSKQTDVLTVYARAIEKLTFKVYELVMNGVELQRGNDVESETGVGSGNGCSVSGH